MDCGFPLFPRFSVSDCILPYPATITSAPTNTYIGFSRGKGISVKKCDFTYGSKQMTSQSQGSEIRRYSHKKGKLWKFQLLSNKEVHNGKFWRKVFSFPTPDKVYLCSLSWPCTLLHPSTSTSQVLGLQACIPGPNWRREVLTQTWVKKKNPIRS
jgi:hypothetical protein